MIKQAILSVALVVAVVAAPAHHMPALGASRDALDGFVARSYQSGAVTMPYRLFVPAGYSAQKKYPLILWLHGAGGIGADNEAQILGDQIPGTRTWTQPATQARYPAFVLVPQSSGGWLARRLDVDTLYGPVVHVVAILDSLEREFSIDRRRIYVAGQSNGGYAVWDLITRRPERVAAAIVVCGLGGDPTRAARVAAMPIWVFQGDVDDVRVLTGSRQMVGAIQQAGGHPRYTEYTGAGHDIWTRAFSEPELVDWLFAQHN